MSFQQALSGLSVAANNLAVIGHNIANSSTIGFKAGRAAFADLYASSLGNSASIGIGASVQGVRQQFTQGNVVTTNNPLDLTISGNGFFCLSNNGARTYARNGQFSVDRDGYIVNNSGARLTGYQADSLGQIVSSAASDLRISLANLAPRSTSNAEVGLNLDSRATAPTSAFSVSDPASYNSSTALTVYDSQGNTQTLTLYFRKTANNNWQVHGALNGTALTPSQLGTLTFGANGTLASDVSMNVSIPLTNGATTPMTFPLKFSAADMTQFGNAFAVSKLTQDGFTTGRISGFTIDDGGVILSRYSNGQTRPQGQIVLANFVNAQGLTTIGGNQWAESTDSGSPLVATPGSGSLGTLVSGALEEANVDLTEELVNMITAQRNYQANAQTIRTQDQVLQTIVNLR